MLRKSLGRIAAVGLVGFTIVALGILRADAQKKGDEEIPSLNRNTEKPIVLPGYLTMDQVNDGWIALFDGRSIYGWRDAGKANWTARGGELSVDQGKIGLLRTTSQFDHFKLRLDFKTQGDTNSGVFVRTSPNPRSPAVDCFEINIAPPSNPFPTGSFVGRKKAKEVASHDGKWHTMEIVCREKTIQVKLDGELVCDVKDAFPLGRGYIGLQHNSGKIAFRKIHLKPLSLSPLFDGKSLKQWKVYPEFKTKASVEHGAIRLLGGSGQLESKKSFGDFVFQMQGKTNGVHLNSGVFFRSIPGEKMNGYESQIQHGVKDGDPRRPIDCGTGGIFRRKNARRVNAVDNEWFNKTIVATGPHVAVWVNGLQVCDWTDQRKKDKNPRRGLRLEPGTIIFQGHDPTTDLEFRKINVAELDKRVIGNQQRARK